MFSHAIRVTLPYADCSGIISLWADRSSRAIAYQHTADEEVSKTHVHLALWGCEVKAEALKRMWPEAPGKGNEFWAWKELGLLDNAGKYLTYMSKGKLAPKYLKNISEDRVEKSRQAWVDPVKDDKTGDNSTYKIMKIIEMIESKHTFKGYSIDIEDDDNATYMIGKLLEVVRKETFKFLWGEKRIVPHASHYKIIAGSVFLRMCEKYNYLDEGQSLLQNLWY